MSMLQSLMSSLQKMMSMAQSGARSHGGKKESSKLDPIQQSNLAHARKVLDESEGEELKALLPWATKYGIDTAPYEIRAGITTQAEKDAKQSGQVFEKFMSMIFGGGKQQQSQTPTTTSAPTPSAATQTPLTQAPPAQSERVANLEKDFFKNWSVTVASDAKGKRSTSFTRRKPGTEEEKIKDEYISSLSPDQQNELAQSLLEGATNIQQEDKIAKDGSKVERTVGRRGGKTIFKGPWRTIGQSTQARIDESVASRVAAEKAVASTEIERSYSEYTKLNETTGTPSLPLSDWRSFTTTAGQNALLSNFGAPRDAMGNMLKTLVDGPKGKDLRVKRASSWMKVRALASQYGIPEFTLQVISERVFADLLLRDDERKFIEDRYNELKEKLNADTQGIAAEVQRNASSGAGTTDTAGDNAGANIQTPTASGDWASH